MGDGRAVVLIDGDCTLCRRGAGFVTRNAAPQRFRFVALRSDEGRRLAKRCSVGAEAVTSEGTLVLVRFEGADRVRCHVRSAAVVRVFAGARWPVRALAVLWVVPRPLRDLVYRWVARRRHRLAGTTGEPGDTGRGDA